MSIFLRLFWFKILVVLCVSYSSVVAKTSSPHFYITAKYYNTSEQTTLTAGEFQNRFDPFELIEKDERNEENDNQSKNQNTGNKSDFSKTEIQGKSDLLTQQKSYLSNFLLYHKVSLLVLFHSWKFHI